MHAILEKIANHLSENNWKFIELGEQRLLVTMTDGVINWDTDVRVIEEGRALVLLTWLPVRIPREKRSEAAYVLAQLNFNSYRAGFQINVQDGQILCCTNQLVGKSGLPTTCIPQFLGEHFARVSNHFPDLLRLALGGTPVAPPAENGSPTCQENDRRRLN